MNAKTSDSVVVATFNDREKALSVKVWLEKLGIHANAIDETKLQRLWFWSRPFANHRVCVGIEDAGLARQFLKSEPELLKSQICCLECGSPQVEYPQFTRKFVTTTLMGELACWMGITQKMFYCVDCHHMWPTSERVPPKTDVLNWPVRHIHPVLKRSNKPLASHS